MVVQKFSAVQEGLASTSEIDEIFVQFLASPGWQEFQTRTTRRLTDQYTFDGDRERPPPPHLQFVHGLVQQLIRRLQSGHPDTEVIPLQCFFCMYENGEDACPNHAHDCRQLTMSFGDERAMNIEGRFEPMQHGDVIVLDGEQHGIPKQQNKRCQPRVSINIFFTTALDMATREVSVNHRSSSSYQQSRSQGKGKGKGKNRMKGQDSNNSFKNEMESAGRKRLSGSRDEAAVENSPAHLGFSSAHLPPSGLSAAAEGAGHRGSGRDAAETGRKGGGRWRNSRLRHPSLV